MITLNFCPKHEKKRGPLYWKLNSSILQNKEYQNKITFWQKWQQRKQNRHDPTVWWDNGKRFLYKTKRNRKRALTPIADRTADFTNTKEQRPNQDKYNRRQNRRNRKLPT